MLPKEAVDTDGDLVCLCFVIIRKVRDNVKASWVAGLGLAAKLKPLVSLDGVDWDGLPALAHLVLRRLVGQALELGWAQK